MIQKKALSIAGSDSSGGAGIQADLKTFSALGLYGATVISTLTAQNTKTVSNVFVVPETFFKDQLESTLNDIQPDVIKIGVLFDKSIMHIVKKTLRKFKNPIIVDPVLVSGTGAKLMDDNSISVFKNEIIPIASVLTPNLYEAQRLSGIKIHSKKDLELAAQKICNMGAEITIIKGGHFKKRNKEISDFFYELKRHQIHEIVNPRININETHGTGCNFSSALSCFIAMGKGPKESFILANSYVRRAITNALKVGAGVLVANPLHEVYKRSEKFMVLTELQEFVDKLNDVSYFTRLIPETKTNFVFSIPNPCGIDEIAGVSGRISGGDKYIHHPNVVKFGASNHVSKALLIASSYNPQFRSAINIRNNPELVNICKKLFVCSKYDRRKEPLEQKMKEGSTINWGIKEAFKSEPNSQVIYHDGDVGKEAMILIFATGPNEILNNINLVLKHYYSNIQHYK